MKAQFPSEYFHIDMELLTPEEIDQVSGGLTARQFGWALGFIGMGALGLAVAPVAAGAGLIAASVGLGTAGGVLGAGGALLLTQP